MYIILATMRWLDMYILLLYSFKKENWHRKSTPSYFRKRAMLGVGRGQDVEMQPVQRTLSTEVVGLLWLDQNAGTERHRMSLLHLTGDQICYLFWDPLEAVLADSPLL